MRAAEKKKYEPACYCAQLRHLDLSERLGTGKKTIVWEENQEWKYAF